MLCHQSKAFVVPKTETMRVFFDYIIRPPTIKGFTFSSAFSIFLNLNWTLFNLNQGFSSGSGKSLELNWWFSLGFGKNRLWTKLNQTFPSLLASTDNLLMPSTPRPCKVLTQQHRVVWFCGSVLNTKSKEDLDSFWWQVVNLQRNKFSVWRITVRGFRHECYITVGTFAQLGLGSLSKYTEWSVLSLVAEY